MATVVSLVNGVFTEIQLATSSGTTVPLYIADGDTFSVPANSQVLFTEMIDCDGLIDLDGLLVEVN